VTDRSARSWWALALVPGLVVLGIWELAVYLDPSREFFLGSPSGVFKEFLEVAFVEKTLLRDALITSGEALAGFLLGTAIGTSCGLMLWSSQLLHRLAKPYLAALGAVPVFALGPVFIFWLGTGLASKVALAFLSTFAIAVQQAHSGAREADQQLQRVVQVFGGTRRQVFCKVIVPSAMIWVLAGVRLNVGMGLLGAVIGEFLSSRAGLGHMIIVAEGLYNVNRVWAGVITIAAIALLFHAAATPIEKRARQWKT
jgi:NitT/TauT family transport system permease protein